MDFQEMEEALNTTNSEQTKKVLSPEGNCKESDTLTTKQDVIDKLNSLYVNAQDTNKQELDSLQQLYHKIAFQELANKKAAFLEEGGLEEDFVPPIDALDEELKAIVIKIKDKRKNILAEENKLRAENLKKKEAIIERLKTLLEAPDEANNSYEKFKALQEEWNEIKLIPQSEAKRVWNTYHLYIEQFYDLLKLNNEFRAYDFKKNLELKNELCTLAEELDKEPNIISAFHQLQIFHEQWREIGPVSKELREEVWSRFKEASTVINKKHQEYFDNLKEQENINLEKKTSICTSIENINLEQLQSSSDWEEITQKVLNLQEEWKTIGFTPKKVNGLIFDRFRTACDKFFDAKSEFYKDKKEKVEQSILEKEELCKIAEENQDSKDWKKTTDLFIDLQDKWKKTYPIYRKKSDELWTRFSTACDKFFEARNKEQKSKHQLELDNLSAKNEVIQKIEKLVNSEELAKDIDAEVKELIKEWNTIGHVPYKQKDLVYKNYKSLINKHFDNLNKGIAKKKINAFKESVTTKASEGNKQDLSREKERLNRNINRLKSDLQTYENNLGFLTLSSKKGSAVLNELNNKMGRLKDEIKLLEKKVEILNKGIKS